MLYSNITFLRKFMKKTILAIVLAAGAFTAHAQNELSNFTATGRGGVINTFATDYQVIGINPANLGSDRNAIFAFTIGEAGIGVNSKSLEKPQLKLFLKDTNRKLTQAEKHEFAAAFTSEDAVNLNADFTTLAISGHIPKIGGIAISNRQRVTGHVGLNQNAAEILFLGKNAPVFANYKDGDRISIRETLAPTSIQASIMNEFNIAAGTAVSLPGMKLNIGAGYKYIQGIAVLDVVVDNDVVTAYSSISPFFDINYGTLVNNPDFNQTDIGTGRFKPVGEGHGYDFGLSAEFGNSVRGSVSVTDLGNMVWRGHLLTANDEYITKVTSEGINSFNFFKEVANIVGGTSDSLFNYEPGRELKKNLPTKLRLGAGLKLSDKVETGLDVCIPMNDVAGNLVNPFIGAGIDYKVAPLLRLSSGFSAGAGYGFSLPLGVTFVTPVYEFGIATRDVLGLVGKENPYLSVAFGFLRFKFKAPESK